MNEERSVFKDTLARSENVVLKKGFCITHNRSTKNFKVSRKSRNKIFYHLGKNTQKIDIPKVL